MTAEGIDVLVSEVGPRDGLQSIKRTMPTEAKLDWIEALAASGLREIEVGSFVSPRLLPQMADCAKLVTEANKLEGLTVLALVPNLKGAEHAIEAGARKLTMPVSASQEHSLSNIGKTPIDAIEEVRRVCAFRDSLPVKQRPDVEIGISTAFGCTLEGTVSEDWVIEMAGLLAKAGADSIGLSDTTGYANPAQIKRMFRRLLSEIGASMMGGAHLHNTRGQGLANVVAALEVDVTTFDSSLGGLGGCPYAPGATGNIVTEDLVFMLEAMGLRTGVDIDALIAAREVLLRGLPDEALYGNVPEVGLPKGFTYASKKERNMTSAPRPLDGVRVVEFSHMVMGPTCGLILADLGADVVKVEPAEGGDKTRRLPGSGAGYFGTYNRNKRSISVNLKSVEGLEFATQLVRESDVLLENFGAGVLDRLGLGFDAMQEINPRLVYCALKGFLSGPYELRAALDEVVQMMGGLAYMTGPEGRPLRAGASVNDVMGGLFGVIAIQAALWERQRTGKGTFVRAGLFENNLFLVAQHMVQYQQTGVPAVPMPERVSAWAVYDLFETADGEKIFVGVVSDKQWTQFCNAFGLGDLLQDAELQTNVQRVARRDAFMPRLREMFARQDLSQAATICERVGLPFAPILRPDQLFDDPHVNHTGATVEVTLSNGVRTQVPTLPFEYGGTRPGLYRDLPQIGEHNEAVARELGYSDEELERLRPSLGSAASAETEGVR